jgi:hypothetical protein
MQFKKLAAITGSALMAGLCLAAPVLAVSATKLNEISKMVSTTGTVLPVFVIGAAAQPKDVAGAVDIAAGLAKYAKTTTTVTTTTGAASITGGVSMATSTNPLTIWNYFASSKQVLTANDLPDVLVSGNYVDAGSVTTPYSQYLTFTNAAANGQIVYDTPNGGTQPSLGLKFTGTNQVYNYQIAFTKQISETITTNSVANMVNTQISMLGKTWTITAAAVSSVGDLALTMLSGKNSQTVTTETPATYTVGDKTYTVKLVAVGTINSVAAATITVSGGNLASEETVQILSGGTKALSDGTLIGVTSIFTTTKTGAIDSATVFIGADKLELEDTTMGDSVYYAGVKLNGATINDVTVSMTGNTTATTAGTLTLNTIEVKWLPSLEQFVTSGNSLTDPAFGGFKIFFGGISPALDDTTNRETITVTPSGTTAGLSFKTADGQTLNQNFVRSFASGTGNVSLQDAGGYALHVYEGETAVQNEYVVLGQNSLGGSAQNPFGHIIRILTLNNVSTSTSSFQDVASGATLQVTGGNTTMYLDGQAYKVCLNATGNGVRFTWGTGALYCAIGGTANETYDIFPTIQTGKGAWIAITNPVSITGLANATTYTLNLPTGSIALSAQNNASSNYTVGAAKYEIKLVNGTATTSSIAVKATDTVTPTVFSTPGVMIVEGLNEAQVRNVIAFRLDADANYNRVDIPTNPVFTPGTAGTITSTPGVSGTTQNKYMDQFGSYVLYDSTMPGTFSLSYPSSQAQATIAVGKSPTASGGGVGGTVTTDTLLPITADIVKMDTDSDIATVKTANDLIIVGGPCVNQLAAQVLGLTYPACGATSGIPTNAALVQLFADKFATGKTALLVAGWEAGDTKLAAQMVQQGFPGASDTLKAGTKMTIAGTVQSPAYS